MSVEEICPCEIEAMQAWSITANLATHDDASTRGRELKLLIEESKYLFDPSSDLKVVAEHARAQYIAAQLATLDGPASDPSALQRLIDEARELHPAMAKRI